MSIFPNPSLLQEKPARKDLLDNEDEINRVGSRIKRLVDRKRNAIIAYLGPFGAGKSSILDQIKGGAGKSYQWITFELWRYANRQEIWDGFVIQIVADLRQEPELEIADQVEGGAWKRGELIKPLILAVGIVGLGGLVLSVILWSFFGGSSVIDLFAKAFLKYATPVIVALMIVGGGATFFARLSVFQSKRPLRRTFELEKLLEETLRRRLTRPLIIVIEDVDRTTEDGAVFLETLNHFLNVSAQNVGQPVIVVAPQTRAAFDSIGNKGLAGFERSLKIYDETIYFGSFLTDKNIEKFYDALNVDEKYKGNLILATKKLIETYKNNIPIRLLKHVLREVDSYMEIHPASDPIITLVLIMARYMPATYNVSETGNAMMVLTSGNSYGSEQAAALFRALVAANGESITISQFELSFEAISEEILYEKTQPTLNDAPVGKIKLNEKYRSLTEGIF